jgi:hypothetical protein
MTETEQVYEVASDMADRMERAMERAIDYYFSDIAWDEKVLAKKAKMDCYPDGTEIFKIDGTELLEFGPIENNIDIRGDVAGTVHIKYRQVIKRLYDPGYDTAED